MDSLTERKQLGGIRYAWKYRRFFNMGIEFDPFDDWGLSFEFGHISYIVLGPFSLICVLP